MFTCPMHPEIRLPAPGVCPICGMALEPELASAEPTANPELADFSRRFWIGLALTAPVFVLAMGGHVLDLHRIVPGQMSNWIQFGLATPVVLWCGWPFIQRGWTSLATQRLNMFTLVAMGVGVAWAYSVVAVLKPALFPPALRQEDGSMLVDGGTPLRDLNRKLGMRFPVEGAKTLNGLILEHLQDIPEAGTSLKIANYPIEIIQMQDRVVKVVKIFPVLRALQGNQPLQGNPLQHPHGGA